MAPTVHLYTLCWDEADMLGFFFRHYESWVSRFIVYDDGSTDGSREMLEAHPKVELRRFERKRPDSFVLSHKILQDEVWKESRGNADWVVVTALDEHLFVRGQSMSDYLAAQSRQGVTLIPALGFDMTHRTMPVDEGLLIDAVTTGRPNYDFNKLSIFDPQAVRETGFRAGRHSADPVGDRRLPDRDELMLWHYKNLGFDRTAARQSAQGQRLGTVDIAHRYAFQYSWALERFTSFWEKLERESIDLASPAFDLDADSALPRWWLTKPGMTRVGAAQSDDAAGLAPSTR